MKYLKSIILIVSLGLVGCGTNLYNSLDEGDVENEAAAELEKDNPDRAISLLEDALKDDPGNAIYISLLSEAYAQKFGVSLLDIAISMAETSSSLIGTSSDLTRIWAVLPEATDAVIEGVAYAIELLDSIPSESQTDTDIFKLSLLSISLINLQLKALDTNGDGELSAQELLNLSDADAATLLSALGAAASAAGSATSLGENSQKASDSISAIESSISNSEGSTSKEKFGAYFQSE